MAQQLADECVVCGTTLEGPLGLLFHLTGITRSTRNPNVCNRCDAHMQEGRIIELSVLFADLTNFTEMTNQLGPDRTFAIVDAFFKMANEALIKQDAFIDKYIGDAVMAFFNAPIPNVKHARGAVLAALDIQNGLNAVSQELNVALQARIGIASGYARIGRLGSTDRKDYTAIGDVVNLAARLEAFAEPGQIIVDSNAFIQMAEDYPAASPETLDVRGFTSPIEVYRIGKTEQTPSPLTQHLDDPLTTRQRVGLGTVLVTIFSVPCVAATTLSPLAVLLGLGAFMVALSPALQVLDSVQIRAPMQVLAVTGALINLYVIRRGAIQRRAFPQTGLTAHEKRKQAFVIGLAIFTLLAIAYELFVHSFVLGMSYWEPSL